MSGGPGRTATVFIALAVLGCWFSAINRDLPILRNSLFYGRISYHLLDSGVAVARVSGDQALSFGKPLGFSLFALPFVGRLGANVGLKVASGLATLACLIANLALLRRLLPRVADSRDLWLALLSSFFNPLMMYQFWSAYPDSLFTALTLASFLWLDLQNERDAPLSFIPLASLTIFLAILVKAYGLVLIPCHIVYLLLHKRPLDRHRARITLWCISLGVLLALLVAACLGQNPLLDLTPRSSGVGVYAQGAHALRQPGHASRVLLVLFTNLQQFVTFLLVTFNVLLCFLPPGIRAERFDAGIGVVLLLFVGGLLAYRDSWWNLRYYLVTIPFITLYIIRGFQRTRTRWVRVGAFVVFCMVNGTLILNFNTSWGQRLFPTFNSWVEAQSHLPVGAFLVNLDSLRLTAHLHQLEAFRNINTRLPTGATLYYVSDYYRDSAPVVYKRSGLFRPDIRVQPVVGREHIPLLHRPCYLYVPGANRQPGPRETNMGLDLYHQDE